MYNFFFAFLSIVRCFSVFGGIKGGGGFLLNPSCIFWGGILILSITGVGFRRVVRL